MKINVVTESRLYQKWSEKVEDGGIDIDMGLLKARRALNQIHEDLQKNGFTEVSTQIIPFFKDHIKTLIVGTEYCY